jgi:hypothetical protein
MSASRRRNTNLIRQLSRTAAGCVGRAKTSPAKEDQKKINRRLAMPTTTARNLGQSGANFCPLQTNFRVSAVSHIGVLCKGDFRDRRG